MKVTKTFKIGEYCQGGVITVEVNGSRIDVIGKEWDFSAGSKKSSNQSKAKEFTRETVINTSSDARRTLDNFLNDLTSSYYADQVLDWIETKVSFNNGSSRW